MQENTAKIFTTTYSNRIIYEPMFHASQCQSTFFRVSDHPARHLLHWFTFLPASRQYVAVKLPSVNVDTDEADCRVQTYPSACALCWSDIAFHSDIVFHEKLSDQQRQRAHADWCTCLQSASSVSTLFVLMCC